VSASKTNIIDVHVHAFPPTALGELDTVKAIKGQGRRLLAPLARGFQAIQPMMRHLPTPVRKLGDSIGALSALPNLLLERTPEDLIHALDASGVSRCLLIAQPPLCSNEFVLDLARKNPRYIPAVNIDPSIAHPGQKLREYVAGGAKALKIHAAVDGVDLKNPRYQLLLQVSAEFGLPVVLHTGALNIKPLYKNPSYGSAELFIPWIQTFPQTKFVLAHMNFHHPHRAINIAEENPNVWLDTSWQPTEIIGEAVRRVGADRIVFGSDWPLFGQNISVGLSRIDECVKQGWMTDEDRIKILSTNSARLLNL
jgi:predicted TIM-barrel fold metal-dependent hydrolase